MDNNLDYHRLEEDIQNLNLVNFQIGELQQIKQKIEERVASLLHNLEDASKTYGIGKWKVTISTGYIYSLDKEEYEIVKSHLPPCFNPVTIKMSYEINKKIIKDAEKYASRDELILIDRVITKKPKKLHVKVGANV